MSVKGFTQRLRARGGVTGQQVADALEHLDQQIAQLRKRQPDAPAGGGGGVVGAGVWQDAPQVSGATLVSSLSDGACTQAVIRYTPPPDPAFGGVLVSCREPSGAVYDVAARASSPDASGKSSVTIQLDQVSHSSRTVDVLLRPVSTEGAVAPITQDTPSLGVHLRPAGWASLPGLMLGYATLSHGAPEDGDMLVEVSGVLPAHQTTVGCDVYLALPSPGDTNPVQFTLPGWVMYVGEVRGFPGQPFSQTFSVPVPSDQYFASLQLVPPGTVGHIIYAVPKSTDLSEPLQAKQSWIEADPPGTSLYIANSLDWFSYLSLRAGLQIHNPPIIHTNPLVAQRVSGGFRIAGEYMPSPIGVGLKSVRVYTNAEGERQSVLRGEFPYSGTGSSYPQAAGRFLVEVPEPETLPSSVLVQLCGTYADGHTAMPEHVLWESGGVIPTPNYSYGRALVELTAGASLGAVSVASASVQTRNVDGRLQYRFQIGLSGSALNHKMYDGAVVYCRFSGEPVPGTDEDWTALRMVAEHRRGEPVTIYSPWYTIAAGVSTQAFLRPVAIYSDGSRVWGAATSGVPVSVGALDAVDLPPGHNWGFSAGLSGYWDDGNGVRYGKVDASWTPPPTQGLLFGIYEYRSDTPDQPPYAAYKPTEANTTSNQITMWVVPPKNDTEYLHLALVAAKPSEGVWLKPTDYASGSLPVAVVTLPKAGLSEHVTGWSVTVETDQAQDVPRGRFVFSFSPPGDPDYHHVHVYRRPANAQGSPIADWLPDKVAAITAGGPGGWWTLPSQPEYWLFKAVACNSLGQENETDPPVVFVSVPTSAGVTAGRIGSGAVTGPISVDQSGRITVLPGAILAQHIGSVNASSITGAISASQIGSINASQISGQIQSSQIASVAADKISGSILASQIASVNATQISGVIQSGQIGSVNASSVTGVIVSNQLADQILNSARLMAPNVASPVRVSALPSLPNADYPNGCLVLRTTDRMLFKNQNGVWVPVSASSEITGSITAQDVVSVNASAISGLITAGQIQSISANQINGLIQASQIASISGSQIQAGSITADKIASISGSQIQAGSITADKIASISGSQIQAGSITADRIGSIDASKITIGTINANQIGFIYANQLVSGSMNYAVGNLYCIGHINVASNPFSPGSGTVYCGAVSGMGWGVDGFGTGVFQSLQAYSGNFITSLVVNGQSLGNAAFRHVGTGANDVASGNHTHSGYSSSTHSHTVTVTLSLSKQTVDGVEVVTDVSVQSVTCSAPN